MGKALKVQYPDGEKLLYLWKRRGKDRNHLAWFAAVDTIKGFASASYTLNEYGYCWNNPEKYIDLNGKSAAEFLNGEQD